MSDLLTFNSKVVLASSSQSRRQILRKYQIQPIIVKHNINELEEKKNFLHKDIKKIPYVLAKKKAYSIEKHYPDYYIIGSDQILYFENKIFDKPRNLEEAKNNLYKLQGKEHTLISSIYVLKNNKKVWGITCEAVLKLKSLGLKTISKYVIENQETVFNTVGSYKIEDERFDFIKIIKGDKETIMGFPIKKFIKKQ